MIAACGGEPKPVAPVVEPAVDEHKAETDARSLVAEIYQNIDRGQTDSMFSLLSDALIVFGPRKLDATASRANALVALGKVVDPKAKHHAQLRSGGLTIVASPGGHSAWLFDPMSADGQPLAVTAVLSNTSDLWSVSAALIAATPSARQVKAESARDAVVPPGSAAAAKVEPAAADAVDKFMHGFTEPDAWGDELASRTDAVLVGPIAGEVAHGKDAIKRAWKARLKANIRETPSGEFTAVRTADGELVWLSVSITRVTDGADPLPLRIFAIYEKDGAGWKLIALHEAVALDEPGAGAAFKKILPPSATPALPPSPPPGETTVTAKVDVKADPAAKKPDADAAAPATRPAKAKKTKKAKKPKRKPRPKPATPATPATDDSGAAAATGQGAGSASGQTP